MTIDAVENAAVRREVERNEREYRREWCGIELGMHLKLVGRDGQDRAEPLLLLEERGTDIDKTRLEDRAHLGLHLVDVLARCSVDGEIETDFEYALLRLLKRVAQLLEVGIRCVEHRVSHHPLLLACCDLALDFGDFLLEFAEHFVGIHRMDENRDIEHLVDVDDGSEPPCREEAWI